MDPTVASSTSSTGLVKIGKCTTRPNANSPRNAAGNGEARPGDPFGEVLDPAGPRAEGLRDADG